MTDLQMLTQEEVATLLHTSVDNVAMLRRVGVLPSIKTGRNYMFSQASIRRFQSDYEGYDVSSMESAQDAKLNVKLSQNKVYEELEKELNELRERNDSGKLQSGVRYWP